MENKDIKACGLHCLKIKDFGVSIGAVEILKDINLHIHCGQLTVIIGKNGAGKSTLLKAILNEVPHVGTVEFKDVKNNTFEHLKIGYVPQSIHITKNTPTSVYDLFASFITNVPVFLYKQKKTQKIIENSLDLFDAKNLIDKTVCDLSGGELKRVLLAIATTPIPNLLILDEPAAGIDKNGIELFYETIDFLKKEYDLCILLVSHDFSYVKKYSDSVVLLDKTIVCEGTSEEVFGSLAFKNYFGELKKEDI